MSVARIPAFAWPGSEHHRRLLREARSSTTTVPSGSSAKAGRFKWRDSVRLCLEHGSHPSFVVSKLWSYFVPTAPDAKTAKALAAMYVNGRRATRPLVEAILMHPDFYKGQRMVKPPVGPAREKSLQCRCAISRSGGRGTWP